MFPGRFLVGFEGFEMAPCQVRHPANPTLPRLILSYPILPYPTLSYPSLPYPTLFYSALPYPTLQG
jgi:hypothetical protein